MKKISIVLACSLFSSPIFAEKLSTVYQLAIANDKQFLSSKNQQQAGKEVLPQALSYVMPTLSLELSNSQLDNSQYANKIDSQSIDLVLRQSLFDKATLSGLKISKILVKQSDNQFAKQKMNLTLRVATVYFDLLRSVEQYQSIVTELKATQKRYQQVQQSYNIGLAAQTDLFEAQSQLHLLATNKLSLRRNIELAREAIFIVTNSYIDSVIPLQQNLTILDSLPPLPKLLAIAKHNNLDIKLASLQQQQAKSNVNVKKAARYPRVSARVSRSMNTGSNINNINNMTNDYDQTGIFFDINMPLFSGFRVSSEIKQAQYQQLSASNNVDYVERTIMQAIKSLVLQLNTNISQIAAYQVAISSAKIAVEATQGGYQSGTRTILELLTSQSQLHQAQRNLTNSRIDAILTYLNLQYQLGDLSEQHIDSVETLLTEPVVNVQQVLKL